MSIRGGIGCALLGITPIAVTAQCDHWTNDTTESYHAIRSSTIKREVISFIDWVWEEYGAGKKPAMLRLEGESDCDTYASFMGHDVEVSIHSTPFDSSKHRLAYDESGYPFICSIDGKKVIGTDGGLPTERIADISIRIDSSDVRIPPSAFDDLYQPNFCYSPKDRSLEWKVNVARSMDRKRVYIHMSNSDGAGGYAAILIFINGKYVRRVIEGPP